MVAFSGSLSCSSDVVAFSGVAGAGSGVGSGARRNGICFLDNSFPDGGGGVAREGAEGAGGEGVEGGAGGETAEVGGGAKGEDVGLEAWTSSN